MERSPDAFAARLERRLRSTGTPPAAPAVASGPAGDIETLFTAAEEAAAVTGRFDPDAIVRNIQGPTRVAVLSRLASCSVVEVEGKATKWLMQSDRRSDVLKRLVLQQRLDKKLAEPLPDTDRFGQKLRDVLRGSALTVGGLSREDLLATSAAIEATDGLDIARPDESAVRGSIAQLEFLADYTVLLEDGFIGREQELRDLNAFLTDASPVPASPPWTGLVLTGLGGAGKSTLLAKLATDAVNARTATVVALDFDHPGIEPDDTSWLEMEITRQVSCQHPDTGQELRALRQNTRRYKAEFSEQVASFAADAGSYGRSLRSLLFDLQRVLKSSGAANLPLLLVLDTFEDVTQRDLESRTIDWLSEVAERLWPIRLKVIFSGRLFGPSRDLLKKHGVTRVIEIDQLDPPLAEQLLLRNHVPPEWAKRLANSDVLPRRPLELKLLARLVTGPDAPSIDELERELRSGCSPAWSIGACCCVSTTRRRRRSRIPAWCSGT